MLLFQKLLKKSPSVIVTCVKNFSAGLFDELDQAKLTEEIFYDQKPAFFHYKEATEKLTEEDFLQKLFTDS